MPLTVIVGGQFGSEGKGKLSAYLSQRDNTDVVVRCGSTNSGHTVVQDGQKWELRMIPAGFVQPTAQLMLPAGSLIDLEVLKREIEATGVTQDRLLIDERAGIIEPSDIQGERDSNLWGQFGSTQSGVGHALSRRIMRRPDFRIAKDVPELRDLARIGDVSYEVNGAVQRGDNVIVEGTQGYGLSIYHTVEFPYATSRDTTAAGFLAEVGLAPKLVDEVIMAVRTYPIRVAGNSGPLPNEITWEDIQRRSGSPDPVTELTTTTKRVRRVAEFELDLTQRAAVVNGATSIAVHGIDYFDHSNRNHSTFDSLNFEAKSFISLLEQKIGIPVPFIGYGPHTGEFIDRRVNRREPIVMADKVGTSI